MMDKPDRIILAMDKVTNLVLWVCSVYVAAVVLNMAWEIGR